MRISEKYMNSITRYILLIIFLIQGFLAHSQQDALFSQYMFNKLVINPGYAGTRGTLTSTIVGRYQWVNLDGAPKTTSLSVHSPLRHERMGVGGYLYNDILGPMQDVGIIASYSYRIPLGDGQLSFGLQGGIKYNQIDWTKVTYYDETELSQFSNESKRFIPDVNFGMYYYTDTYYIGLSSKHLFEQDFSVIQDGENSVYSKLLRHFYGMAGVAVPLKDQRLVFKPSALVKYVRNAPIQVDINASLLINEVLWVGLSYRTKRAAVFIAEVNINKNFRIGYSFDWFLNELQRYNMGSHEIMIGYDFSIGNTRIRTPRYF